MKTVNQLLREYVPEHELEALCTQQEKQATRNREYSRKMNIMPIFMFGVVLPLLVKIFIGWMVMTDPTFLREGVAYNPFDAWFLLGSVLTCMAVEQLDKEIIV